jgi:arginyl-tRNA synthetase
MSAHNIFAEMLGRIHRVSDELASAGLLPPGLDLSRTTVEPPRDQTHGDMATNVAMVLAKDASKKPRDLAEAYAAKLRSDALVAKVDVAGPGFINLTLKPSAWIGSLRDAVRLGSELGRTDIGQNALVNVEYVSANPTGPMHVGHGRGAVFGDALTNLLAFTGHGVTREYYVNDAGAQVDELARSAFLRYREALGETIGAIPEATLLRNSRKATGCPLSVQKRSRR